MYYYSKGSSVPLQNIAKSKIKSSVIMKIEIIQTKMQKRNNFLELS